MVGKELVDRRSVLGLGAMLKGGVSGPPTALKERKKDRNEVCGYLFCQRRSTSYSMFQPLAENTKRSGNKQVLSRGRSHKNALLRVEGLRFSVQGLGFRGFGVWGQGNNMELILSS